MRYAGILDLLLGMRRRRARMRRDNDRAAVSAGRHLATPGRTLADELRSPAVPPCKRNDQHEHPPPLAAAFAASGAAGGFMTRPFYT